MNWEIETYLKKALVLVCQCLRLGLQPVFPGSWRTSTREYNGLCLIKADFEMNLRARMPRRGKIINNGLFCLAWENLSRIHREYPQFRKWISISSQSPEEEIGSEGGVFSEEHTLGYVRASYLISDSRIDVELKFPESWWLHRANCSERAGCKLV